MNAETTSDATSKPSKVRFTIQMENEDDIFLNFIIHWTTPFSKPFSYFCERFALSKDEHVLLAFIEYREEKSQLLIPLTHTPSMYDDFVYMKFIVCMK